MKTKQIVLFIHGVGNQKVGYSHESRKLISQELRRLNKNKKCQDSITNIVFKEIYWSNITSEKQADLYARFDPKKLKWQGLRKFFISFTGDAIASKEGDNWSKIKQKIDEAINSIKNECPGYNYEFTIIGHSLGTVLISEYLVEQSHNRVLLDHEVINIFTLGSPLAVWNLINGWPAENHKVFNINKKVGIWMNIMDSDDIIAYPLKDVSDKFNAAVCMDYVTNIGSWFKRSSPLSHKGYWTDANVIKPIAQKLKMDSHRLTSEIAFDRDIFFRYVQKLRNW